jgi:drug/metabolite transporter (DMT)-like permease
MSRGEGLVPTILAGALFGTTVPIIKLELNSNIPPELFLELRFAIASAVIFLLLPRRVWMQWKIFRSRPIWIVGLINAAGYITQFQGQVLTSSSNAALIISTAALMIPLLSLFHVRERLGRRKIAGVVTGFVGTGLVVTRGQVLVLGSSEFLGDLSILFTAVTIALVFVLSKNLVEKSEARPVTSGMLLLTSLFVLPTLPLDQNRTINLTLTEWLGIAYLAIFATVGGYYFFMKGLETVSPTVSSIILPIEVIVAVVLSVILFRDPFNYYSATGAVLIVAGVALVSTSS